MFTQPFSSQSTASFLKGSPKKDQITQHYTAFQHLPTLLLRNQYLHQLLAEDEVLFYQVVQRYLKEVLPVLYTPTVGEVVQTFHSVRSHARGLYIPWADRDRIDTLLEPYKDSDISIAILTDGERILGLGDQGAPGIEICTAKAMMYVICARFAPHRLLPIYLDMGTNNAELLADSRYKGWRHPRIKPKEFDRFVDKAVVALRKKFPNIYLHWEDLGRDNANRILDRYQNQFCTFNDDIQGTGVVTLASALTAMKITKVPLTEQKIVIFGGGTAGLGIADQLSGAMQRMGLTQAEARERIWLIGRYGLLFTDSGNLTELQKPYARPAKERSHYKVSQDNQEVDLLCVIQTIKPSFLVGCAGKHGAFTESVIKEMAKHVERPIIFPLSNPITCCEAMPKDILKWTENKALIATGSPFEDVIVEGKKWPISQCNNALAFPGIGLGIKVSGASVLTEDMLWEATCALCEATPPSEIPRLLPDMKDAHMASEKIADAIYQCVQKEKGNPLSKAERIKHIRAQYWAPLDNFDSILKEK